MIIKKERIIFRRKGGVEMDEGIKEEEQKNETDEVKEEISSISKQLDDLNERYKRLFAEFENYKKRTQKESLTKRAEITGDVVSSILPVMDNLEKAAEIKTDDTNYQDGIKLVVKQFADVLNKFGMTEIESVGQKFDPELHEAVSHIEDPSKGDNEIVQEYRKGYKIGTKVIRHSMVIVAN
jgi:molecular chaperone GrpE